MRKNFSQFYLPKELRLLKSTPQFDKEIHIKKDKTFRIIHKNIHLNTNLETVQILIPKQLKSEKKPLFIKPAALSGHKSISGYEK